MAVNARDLRGARLRRWMGHAAFGTIAVASAWWAWSNLSALRSLEREMQAAREEIPALEVAADAVADECGLPPFSDPESLKRFPMEIGRFPSRREMECGNRVTKARSDLIENYLEIDRLRPRIEEAGEAISPSVPIAVALAAGFVVWIWFGEIRHRRPRSS